MEDATNRPKGIVIAGLGGNAGKSVVSVGLVAALRKHGRNVAPFKKGPDYIDAGWLQLAADSPCYNLDPYLMADTVILDSFMNGIIGSEIAVVEGNRGLYDGVDLLGSYSTAELAKLLALPIILVADCTKTTRTMAALILGCQMLDPLVDIRGVVLNRIGSSRHEKTVRQAVEYYTKARVVGAIPRQKKDFFPQRHLGVTPFQEHDDAAAALGNLAACIADYTDMEAIVAMMAAITRPSPGPAGKAPAPDVRIGILRDAAFQFYYAENLQALQQAGAEIVEVNALTARQLPDLDGLYIGGGFPETNVVDLSANGSFRESLRREIDRGLPVYAECGGLIYLGKSLMVDGQTYPMVSVFPVSFGIAGKPQAHGYSILSTEKANPFYRRGEIVKGHEFRYSTVLSWSGETADLAFRLERGTGFVAGRDGLVHKNVLALYTHIHALATPQWAGSLVARAREYKKNS